MRRQISRYTRKDGTPVVKEYGQCWHPGVVVPRARKPKKDGTPRKERVSLGRKARVLPWVTHRNLVLAEQSGRCAVCATPLSAGSGGAALDHDHACCPGNVQSTWCGRCARGVLCQQCNTMLGTANDNPLLLQRGAEYLGGARFHDQEQLRDRAGGYVRLVVPDEDEWEQQTLWSESG
jgi:hypothetical protein